MESGDELEVALLLMLYHRQRQRKRRRRKWVRSIITWHQQQEEYHNLLQEMHVSDQESYFRYLRMPKDRFNCLLAEVRRSVVVAAVVVEYNTLNYIQMGPLLHHQHCHSSQRAEITPAKKLAVTL